MASNFSKNRGRAHLASSSSCMAMGGDVGTLSFTAFGNKIKLVQRQEEPHQTGLIKNNNEYLYEQSEMDQKRGHEKRGENKKNSEEKNYSPLTFPMLDMDLSINLLGFVEQMRMDKNRPC